MRGSCTRVGLVFARLRPGHQIRRSDSDCAQSKAELVKVVHTALLGLHEPRLQIGNQLLDGDVGAGHSMRNSSRIAIKLARHGLDASAPATCAVTLAGILSSSRCSQWLAIRMSASSPAVLPSLFRRRTSAWLARQRLRAQSAITSQRLAMIATSVLSSASGLTAPKFEPRRRLAHRRQAEYFHSADVDPADVELVRVDRRLGRSWIGRRSPSQ